MNKKGTANILLFVLVLAGVVYVIQNNSRGGTYAPISPLSGPVKAPKETMVKNLDASRQLIMLEDVQSEGTLYTFFLSEPKGVNKRVLYAKTVPPEVTMSVPQNSWSPDSTYVFVKETSIASSFLVFRADSEPFADGNQFIDVLSLFSTKVPDLVLSDVTGWDGDGLLHVKTKTTTGASGPSYWFDISSRSFLLLAR